ncbi:MAG: hypothetical protein VYE22_33265 [Myxococcota bacterium]|nr:hypothetical protein [Myxococcota bacterium]
MTKRHIPTHLLFLLLASACSQASPGEGSDAGPLASDAAGPMTCSIESPCLGNSAYACVGGGCGEAHTCEMQAAGCGGALTLHCGCDGRLYEASTCADRPSQPMTGCPPVSCDAEAVVCRAVAPECEGQHSVPSVVDGCWGPCVHPSQCE